MGEEQAAGFLESETLRYRLWGRGAGGEGVRTKRRYKLPAKQGSAELFCNSAARNLGSEKPQTSNIGLRSAEEV